MKQNTENKNNYSKEELSKIIQIEKMLNTLHLETITKSDAAEQRKDDPDDR